jgi:hypothetical protein
MTLPICNLNPKTLLSDLTDDQLQQLSDSLSEKYGCCFERSNGEVQLRIKGIPTQMPVVIKGLTVAEGEQFAKLVSSIR